MTMIIKKATLLLLLAGLIAGTSTCVMEDRVVELVLNESTCASFGENREVEVFVTPVTIDYASELAQLLEDNDISRGEIVAAHLVSVSYGVTEFDNLHDWFIAGSLTVERFDVSDGPGVLFDYLDLSVLEALGAQVPVSLDSAGVGVINRALADFIAGGYPILVFKANNSGVNPPPSADDPIQFSWNACISIQFVTPSDIEVPDPF